MHEYISKNMETHIEGMQEILDLNLLTKEKSRQILSRRQHFEYKISSVTKSVNDYLDYIKYEKYVIDVIRKNCKMANKLKESTSIEYKILRHIKVLFEKAMVAFPNDFNVCTTYYNFLKTYNLQQMQQNLVQKMITNYASVPDAWKLAANHYVEERTDYDNATQILHKGLTLHKSSQMLYTEAIQLELKSLKNNDSNQLTECCNRLWICFKIVFEHVSDCTFILDLLKLIDQYADVKQHIEQFIVKELYENYSQNVNVWIALAEREKQRKDAEVRKRYCNKYREGLNTLESCESKGKLWKAFLNSAFRDWTNSGRQDNEFCGELQSLFAEANAVQLLDENSYINWLSMVNDPEAVQILEHGTRNLPKSVELWKLRIRFAILMDNTELANDLFRNSLSELDKNSLPIWILMVNLYGLMGQSDRIEAVFREAIEQQDCIAVEMRVKYLQWMCAEKCIDDIRIVYHQLCKTRPYNKQLHTVMLQQEALQCDFDPEHCIQVHENACKQFGSGHSDVWYDYLRTCALYKPNDLQEVYSKALSQLPASMHVCLQHQFNRIIKEEIKYRPTD